MATPMTTRPVRPLQSGVAVPLAKVRRPWLRRIAQALEREMGLRLISVALAIGLWIFVNAGQHGYLQTFHVPVSYRDLPAGFVLINPHPDSVTIQVSGPRTLLSIIDPTRLTLRLDLTGVGIGQASFKIGPDAFAVPRHTEVTSVTPSQIVLEIDKYVRREVPIHLVVAGAPGDGYKIATADVTPTTIAVRGPSRELSRIDQVDTEPLSVAGATADFSRTVDLMAPGSGVRMESFEVIARVALAPVVVRREFNDIPVNVRDTTLKFRLDPRRIHLELSGPKLALEKIDLSSAVYIEAAGLAPGSYSVPVQMNLPEGIVLVRQVPEKVKLRLLREKQARPA